MPWIVRLANGQLVEVEGREPLTADELAELEAHFGAAIEQVAPLEERAPGSIGEGEEIAIVGMAGRFPGAAQLEDFWRNLCAGVDPIGEVPRERWGSTPRDEAWPLYGGFLADVAGFDAEFFGITPREATLIDPQQRLLLEVAEEALESAGYAGRQLWDSATGVFIGVSNAEYLYRFLRTPARIERYVGTGNALAIVANRLSYQFNFHGPSLAIDTACSSSLVAVHEAAEALRAGRCDAALAGGVNLLLAPESYLNAERAGILAPDGRCKTFDRQADGYVRAEGVGLVLLRRLSDARAAGDQIRAVIKATGVNQDGRSNGLTAPNGPAQTALLRDVYRRAGVEPASLGYLEAHGSGTALGDPLEVDALVEAFGDAAPRQACALGSVKSNIGHAEAAAGIAGLIKAVLMLERQVIPPHLHLREPNPLARFEQSPFFLADRPRHWPATGTRRIGVSAFGLGGTNAHVVLEQAPAPAAREDRQDAVPVLAVSARSDAALAESCRRLAAYLAEEPAVDLWDMCATLALGRPLWTKRRVFVARSRAALLTALRRAGADIETGLDRASLDPRMLGCAERFLAGEAPDWAAVFGTYRKVRLPAYPFERQHYWVSLEEASATSQATEPVVEAPAEPSFDEELGSWFYRPSWAPAPEPARCALAPRVWLLWGAETALGQALVTRIEATGAAVLRIAADAAPEAVLEALRSESRPVAAVVDVASCTLLHDDSNTAEATALLGRHIERLTRYLQALDRQPGPVPPSYVVTWNAFAAAPNGFNPWGASLASLVQVAAGELPRLALRAIDVEDESQTPQCGAEALLAELQVKQAAPLILLRDGRRWTRSVEPYSFAVDAAQMAGTARLRPDGVYLITGGFGQMGLDLAEWFVGAGASTRTIVLLGSNRPQPGTAVCRRLEALAERGARIEELEVDVADGSALRRAIADVLARHGHLHGVVHTAGRMQDALLCTKTSAQIGELLAGKAIGAWQLHEATRGLALDFFVLCSSTASIQGERGHAVYAAANAALDTLARHRRAVGLPAVALNWGPWEGTAAAASAAYLRLMHQRGTRLIPRSAGVQAFAAALACDEPQLAVIRLTPQQRHDPLGVLGAVAMQPAPAWSMTVAAARAASVGAQSMLATALERYRGIGPLIDALCRQYIVEALARLDGWRGLYSGTTIAELSDRLKIVPPLRRAFARLIDLLVTDHLLRRDATGRIEGGTLPVSLTADDQLRALTVRFPDVAPLLRFLHRAGSSLADLLVGRRQVLEVLFPAAAADEAETLYRDAPFADYFRQVAAAVLVARAARQPQGEPLRILEIGAGTGATAKPLLAALVGHDVRYTFTDISPTLVHRAELALAGQAGIEFRRFDVERNPIDQGFDAAAFDVIVAADVLHATRDVVRSLQYAARLLRPGGLLVLLEATRALRLGELTFGLTEGWWQFTDDQHRDIGPLLTAASWRRGLQAAGFAGVEVFPDFPVPTDSYFDHELLLAEWPAVESAMDVEPSKAKPDTVHGAAEPPIVPPSGPAPPAELRTLLVDRLRAIVARVSRSRPESLVVDAAFVELGVDSLMLLEVLDAVGRELGVPGLSPSVAFDHPTLAALAGHLLAAHPDAVHEALQGSAPTSAIAVPATSLSMSSAPVRAESRPAPSPLDATVTHDQPARTDIAVIGYACRFPGAQNADEYWRLLIEERECVGPVPSERIELARALRGPFDVDPRDRGGFLRDVDAFDAGFFRITPLEAQYLDPRQRLFLEVAQHAAEHAGYGGNALRQSNTGVFVGVGTNDYLSHCDVEQTAEFWATGSTPSTIASRLAFYFDLRGPCLPVDTACSSALVALHLAVQSLRSGQCAQAFVGGVHLNLRLENFRAFRRMGALSADGHCRPFAAAADGFVPSEGCGVVLLKPLAQALADGDCVYGVIKGTAVNNDGRTNGLTAPSASSQTRVLTAAWRDAAIDPRSLSYLEAHGTGTPLGDPIEFEALTAAFRQFATDRQVCRIGSVKSNIGHCEAAAGMAGLIKLLLCFSHRTLPATLHVDAPNPHLRLVDSPWLINDRSLAWQSAGQPRRAAVSAFGFSGTNAHVVLEEAPATQLSRRPGELPLVYVLSARSPTALQSLAQSHADRLSQLAPGEFADACFTVCTGRAQLPVRLAIIARDLEQLHDRLLLVAQRSPAALPGSQVFYEQLPDTGFAASSVDRELRCRIDSLPQVLQASLAAWCPSALAEFATPAHSASYTAVGRQVTADEWRQALAVIAELLVRGFEIDWQEFFGAGVKRLALPTYPYGRRSYWLPLRAPAAEPAAATNAAAADFRPLVTSRPQALAGLQYELVWEPVGELP
ncbi:MAG: SDR family NAD(P)-dependent oxidoreductase, partial [Pirellulales bacterium]|nr:SDR family NAD(P)-dependent oxidoreductase [Pirellulales bacterium]